ncbi:MAG: hypothetical protein V5B36_14725 [Candidatus Accumulibacter sp. UW25]
MAWSTTAAAMAPHRAPRQPGSIEDILGYIDEPEIIHRDNLILT